jgi:hypothetical protein
MARKRGKWVTVRSKDQKPFRGKGKDVKKTDVLKLMREAAKKVGLS